MATNKYILHFIKMDLISRINIFVCQNYFSEYVEVSSECSVTSMYNYNACDITRQDHPNGQSCMLVTLQLAPGVVTNRPVSGQDVTR